MGSLRAVLVCGAALAWASPAVSQASGTEDWVCYARNPNAADRDSVFETSLRVSNGDSTVVVSHSDPKRPKSDLRYSLLENDRNGISAIHRVQEGPSPLGYGLGVFVLNKRDGSFRAGEMVIAGFHTSAVGTCNRKGT